MGARTDAALSVFVLVAVALGFVLTNATFSTLAFAFSGFATLAFEAVAARDADAVRAYWERRPVQVGTVVLALVGVVVGAMAAPSSVFSAMAGALVTYLGFLAIVTATRRSRA